MSKTIEEIRQAKQETEHAILALLVRFTRENSVMVRRIEMEQLTTWAVAGPESAIVTKVSIETESI